MTAHQTGLAARGFGSEQVRTARGMEYDAFSRVTRQLQRALAGQDSPAVAAGMAGTGTTSGIGVGSGACTGSACAGWVWTGALCTGSVWTGSVWTG